MRFFQTRHQLFDWRKTNSNVRKFRFESVAARSGAHVETLSDSFLVTIISVTKEVVADPGKSERDQIGV
jgi:hypothetical protein